jgi:ring-1,2-phenylacetyl-CoA epoxidase subunit PaaD
MNPTLPTLDQLNEWLGAVTDPEVPALSILDLGIVRDVSIGHHLDGQPEALITITPTYSGCPAMDAIAIGIRMALLSRGVRHVRIEHRLSPAWTTEWMSEAGRAKLLAYGIAPPVRKSVHAGGLDLFAEEEVACPRCGSMSTTLTSQYGPTSCKSLYQCNDCREPFEHFKCH